MTVEEFERLERWVDAKIALTEARMHSPTRVAIANAEEDLRHAEQAVKALLTEDK